MSEYMEKHTVSRLVGSPPGYVGYEEGGQLTEAVRRKPFSVVLFDEIEKAHPDVFNTLLQILEEGRLTDSQGRSVDFRNTVLIMTSNLGTQDLRKANVGFTTADSAMSYERMKEKVNDALKAHFRPEFLNRIDETIVFHEHSLENVIKMVDLMLKRLIGQLEGQGLGIEVTQAAKEELAKVGYDPQLGARPLRRAIQRQIEDILSEKILYKTFSAGEIIVVDVEPDPERKGKQRFTFHAVEGFVPPASVELATTATNDDVAEPPHRLTTRNVLTPCARLRTVFTRSGPELRDCIVVPPARPTRHRLRLLIVVCVRRAAVGLPTRRRRRGRRWRPTAPVWSRSTRSPTRSSSPRYPTWSTTSVSTTPRRTVGWSTARPSRPTGRPDQPHPPVLAPPRSWPRCSTRSGHRCTRCRRRAPRPDGDGWPRRERDRRPVWCSPTGSRAFADRI
jgi:hypothetical protein